MNSKRLNRLNSLLREVISEVIRHDVDNPNISQFTSITSVEITPDLKFAKVYVSVIGNDKEKENTINALNQSAGFISIHSSKKMTIRYFPSLTFIIDTTVEKQMKIEKILKDIEVEKNMRNNNDSTNDN